MPSHDDGTTDAEQYVDQLDREIKPGDVVYDLNGGSWLQVLYVAAESVRDYDERNDGRDLLTYAGNQLTHCTEDDRVVAAVYLNKNTTKSAGGNVYDFPSGRLVRFVTETADDDLKRVQDELREEILSDLWAEVRSIREQTDGSLSPEKAMRKAVKALYGFAVFDVVEELTTAKTTGEDGDEDDEDDFFPADPAGDQ